VKDKGSKFDTGKAQIHLVPPDFIVAVARVLEFGAGKYGEWNWQKGLRLSRIYDSTLRHMLAWQKGEDLDPESKLPHVWHAACNTAFMTWFLQHKPELDDRQKNEKVRKLAGAGSKQRGRGLRKALRG
jgi:hypothetical protein